MLPNIGCDSMFAFFGRSCWRVVVMRTNGYILIVLFVLLSSCSNQNKKAESVSQNPRVGFIEGVAIKKPVNIAIRSRSVSTNVVQGIGRRGNSQMDIARNLTVFEKPTPKTYQPKSQFIGDNNTEPTEADKGIVQTKSIQSIISAGDTGTNITNTGGSLFIPADPHGAAGHNHVVNAFNVSIEFYQKNGTQNYSESLKTFFSALNPANFTFDPRVVYDHFENRWVVMTLVKTDVGNGDSSNTSLVLIAVSDDDNPNNGWSMAQINTSINIGGDLHWWDYPGFGLDEEAIYVTGNMFQYADSSVASNPGTFGGNRVLIIDKGLFGGFYAGGALSGTIYDQNASSGGFELTQIPAQIYGIAPSGIGTWLAGYSGLASNTTGESFLQMIRIDDPLGSAVFTRQLVNLGVIDGLTAAIPGAPQSGTVTTIDSGDRRVIGTVWRSDSLYFTTEVQSIDMTELDEATVHWGQVDTSTLTAPALVQNSNIGGETDIGTGTYTAYGSIAVNADGGVMVGFSGSNSNIFPSSYFVHRSPMDPLGTMRPAKLISAGEAFYIRTFGGSRNRWGDYSATAVDPDEACFWVYNKHAITQGFTTGTAPDEESGRYGTTFAHFCNDAPVASDDSAAVNQGQTVTTVNGSDTSLLTNDNDADTPDDTLSMLASAVSGPSNGSVTLNSNGTFSYTHNGTLTTTDSFVYRVCDDGSPSKCGDGTVNITITLSGGGNQPPVANDDSIALLEAATATLLVNGDSSVLDNDTDANDPVLAAILNTGPSNGALTLNNDGTFSYAHDGSETITDSFSYDACDDNAPTPACDTATVTISITPVNDAPVAMDDSLTVANGSTGTVLDSGQSSLLQNDTDAENDTLALSTTVVSGPTNGSITLNIDGTFSYTHNSTVTSNDSFIYEVCDNGTPSECAQATVNVLIFVDRIFSDSFETPL